MRNDCFDHRKNGVKAVKSVGLKRRYDHFSEISFSAAYVLKMSDIVERNLNLLRSYHCRRFFLLERKALSINFSGELLVTKKKLNWQVSVVPALLSKIWRWQTPRIGLAVHAPFHREATDFRIYKVFVQLVGSHPFVIVIKKPDHRMRMVCSNPL